MYIVREKEQSDFLKYYFCVLSILLNPSFVINTVLLCVVKSQTFETTEQWRVV